MASNYSQKAGLPPGTLTYLGVKPEHDIKISMIDYDESHLEMKVIEELNVLPKYHAKSTVSWINLDGVHNLDLITEIGKIFTIHPLMLEDIANTSHRPKLEEQDEHIFFTLKMLFYDDSSSELSSEQVSMVLGKNYLISFQEYEADIFDQVRERIRSGSGRIRGRGADYLVYALVDAVVDSYFEIIEKLEAQVDLLEDRIQFEPDKSDFHQIMKLKKEFANIKRYISPLREALGFFEKSESELIDVRTKYFFRDVFDHILLASDSLEASRDRLSIILDTFNSTIGNRMNQVMKTLTIISTIFIPLTFIAGLYGMNFHYMPELQWKWAYPAVLGLMGVILIGMIIYLKKRKWM